MNRRSFLLSSAALCGSNAIGANSDIRVAVAGFRAQGRSHIQNYLKMPGVRIVALCDPDRAVLDRQVAELKQQGVTVEAFTDIRRMLERKDIDAVSTATPNHWHALLTVWACQAGKDVCVEKPVSHNIWEGRKMVEAARKYNRIVQADLDMRSSRAADRAFEFLQAGGLGKVRVVRIFDYKFRRSIGKMPGRGHIPDTIDYDLWCGPAKKGPIDRAELHYDWHWVWDTGGGELANNGPHQLDAVRWALREPGLPRRAMGFGGRFGYEDAGEVPNTFVVFYQFATAPVIVEIRALPDKPGSDNMDAFSALTRDGVRIRNSWPGGKANCSLIFECEGGYLDISDSAAYSYKGQLIRQFSGEGSVDPQSNFIRAVRSRKREDIKTDIEQGHLSACLSHMGNISYRLGAARRPEEVREALESDRDGLEAYGRFREHLAVHNIDLAAKPLTLGPWVEIDNATERFTGPNAAEANRLLKRDYRAPYTIPENV